MGKQDLTLQLEQFDPIARLLLKSKLTPLKFGFLILGLNVLIDGFLGFRYNVFISNTENPGLLQDITALSFDFLIQPLICGAYLWTITGSNKLFTDIMNRGILKSYKFIPSAVQNILLKYKKYHIFPLALILGIVFAFAQAAAYMEWVPWRTFVGYLYIHPTMSFARLPFWFLTFYGIAYAIFNIAITTSILETLFKDDRNVNINMLHPDKCGGLGIIGQYATRTGYIIAPIGLFASVSAILEIRNNTFGVAYPIHYFLLVYILIAPIVFALPIWEAHKTMKCQKDREIVRLADSYQRKYKKAIRAMEEDKTSMESDLDQIQKLHKEISDKFPVWPFNLGNLREFAFAITSPLLPILISVSTDLIKDLLIAKK